VLFPEEHNAVFAEGIADLRKRLVAERPAEIDAGYFGADMPRQRPNPDFAIRHAITAAPVCTAPIQNRYTWRRNRKRRGSQAFPGAGPMPRKAMRILFTIPH